MVVNVSNKLIVGACAVGLAVIAGSLVTAQPTKDAKPGVPTKAPAAQPGKDVKPAPGQPEMPLPPGWTSEDMQTCRAAGTPGEMHKFLAKHAGTWRGQFTMWMGPETEPSKSECTETITTMLDGHYIKCEFAGEMPEMGPFNGFGLTGFDNVTQKFVATWIDNHNTGIMNGTGELSGDGKVLTVTYTKNCPLTKKPTVMRQVQTHTSDNTMTMEMFTTDPKSGKEYKCVRVETTRK